jgi:hypothetical protein
MIIDDHDVAMHGNRNMHHRRDTSSGKEPKESHVQFSKNFCTTPARFGSLISRTERQTTGIFFVRIVRKSEVNGELGSTLPEGVHLQVSPNRAKASCHAADANAATANGQHNSLLWLIHFVFWRIVMRASLSWHPSLLEFTPVSAGDSKAQVRP